MQASRGIHGSTYTKAFASLKSYTPELMAEMEHASRALGESSGQPVHAKVACCDVIRLHVTSITH